MTIQHYAATVTTTPTIIAKGIAGQRTQFKIMNTGTAQPAYLGDSTLTVAVGYALTTITASSTGARLEIVLNAEDVLYAVTNSGTTTLAVIATGA